MSDAYINAFKMLVSDVKSKHGYELPSEIESYVVVLLADHINRPNWVPQNSFAESLYLIETSRDAKVLGDECLFLCGAFPDYGKRRGLNVSYYSSIGQSSYHRASVELNPVLFGKLCRHFDFVSHFINKTLNPTI